MADERALHGMQLPGEKTVARHLSNIFTKLDVTSRTAAAALSTNTASPDAGNSASSRLRKPRQEQP